MSGWSLHHDQPPAERLVIPLARCEGTTPDGLEQMLCDLINATSAALKEPHFVSHEKPQWRPAKPDDQAAPTAQIEAKLYHAIDEIATKNPERVLAQQQQSPSTKQFAIDGADGKIRDALIRLHELGISIDATVEELVRSEV